MKVGRVILLSSRNRIVQNDILIQYENLIWIRVHPHFDVKSVEDSEFQAALAIASTIICLGFHLRWCPLTLFYNWVTVEDVYDGFAMTTPKVCSRWTDNGFSISLEVRAILPPIIPRGSPFNYSQNKMRSEYRPKRIWPAWISLWIDEFILLCCKQIGVFKCSWESKKACEIDLDLISSVRIAGWFKL